MIDREFEQMSEEHMKSMSKLEGPAQEPQVERIVCDNCEGQGGFDGAEGGECRDCCGEGYISVPATPAPSQPAGAREFCWECRDWLGQLTLTTAQAAFHELHTLRQQTAAKDAAILYECEQKVAAIEELLAVTDRAEATERERDSLRVWGQEAFIVIEALNIGTTWELSPEVKQELARLSKDALVNAALKAGKDGQQ